MSDGNTLIFISARRDPKQAFADVKAFLEVSNQRDFGLEDIPALLQKFYEGGDAPFALLPQDTLEAVLTNVRIVYALEEWRWQRIMSYNYK
jgi:hypothetical protein